MVNSEAETRDAVSDAKKRFPGVTKVKNKWQARVRNPLLRTDVHLGYYGTPEEAALVVQKKKAEIDETLKGEEKSSMGTCRGYFKGKKLPTGVSWNNGKYHVRMWNPRLKKMVSGGYYKTFEEAADAADRKREELREFREMYGGISKKPERLVANKSGCMGEPAGDVKVPVPPGVNDATSGSGKTCGSDFDRAVSLGIINEYGQLLGEYSELDKHMEIKIA